MYLIERAIIAIRNEGIFIFFKKLLIFLKKFLRKRMEPLLIPYAIVKLKKGKQINRLENLVEFTFNFNVLKIAPNQIKGEIIELLKIIKRNKPKNILEIGTANCGTLFLFSQVADPNATIISIDLPSGKFGGGYPTWKMPLYKSFAKGIKEFT